MKLEFDPQADAVYLELTDAEIEESKEIQPGIIIDYDAKGRIVGIEVLYVLQVLTSLEETVAYQQLVGIGKKEGRHEDHGFEPEANVDFCDYGKKQNCQ